MTVQSINRRNDYTGNGASAQYDYSFYISDPTLLKVTQANTSGIETTLSYPSDYSVAGVGVQGGGSITLTAGNLPAGYHLTIRRILPLKQLADLANQGGYYPDIVEMALDDLTGLAQQHQDEIDRSIKSPETEPNIITLPTVTQRANNLLGFDAAGYPIAAVGVPTVPTTPFAVTLLDDVDASAAQTTLGISTYVKTLLDDVDASAARSTLRIPSGITSVSASVASNALTLTYNGGDLDFRNATLASGVPISGVVVPSNSIVVPATATLGTASGVPSRLVLIEAYNGGTPVACVVNLAGTAQLDETNLISPTTISTGSTSANTIYSASAVGANSPYRIVGFIDNQQATAGLWASSPTKIQGMGGQARAALLPLPRQYVALALAGIPARDSNTIPPNVDEITCVIQGLSTVGTSLPIIQVGTASGGVINTGYTGSTGVTSASTAASVNHSSGILIEANTNAAASVRTGQLSLRRLGEGSNTWVYTGIMGNSDGARINYIAGSIALSEALNKVRITTVGGLDDMDAGSFNVYYTYRGA